MSQPWHGALFIPVEISSYKVRQLHPFIWRSSQVPSRPGLFAAWTCGFNVSKQYHALCERHVMKGKHKNTTLNLLAGGRTELHLHCPRCMSWLLSYCLPKSVSPSTHPQLFDYFQIAEGTFLGSLKQRAKDTDKGGRILYPLLSVLKLRAYFPQAPSFITYLLWSVVWKS